MNFIKDNVKSLYFKLLIPSVTGAVVMSVYSFVDTVAVGQSEGAIGTGAMAVIAPVYGLMVFLATLCGVGGSVMMSVARGEGKEEKAAACFTVSVILMSIITLVVWGLMALFMRTVFRLFGANADVMGKTIEYGRLIIWFLPAFILSTFLGSFIRNDGAPQLAMRAVVIGGCINIFGDWFLVFPLKMGMTGAGIATVIGTVVQSLIMVSYFFRKECGLRFVRPRHCFRGFLRVLKIGIATGLIDLGSVVLGIVMNNQILRYGGTAELAVYGVLATIMSLFQAIFGGVGQAAQPLVSANYGAWQGNRILRVWNYSLRTVLLLGVCFTLIGELVPVQVIKLFMVPSLELLEIAPRAFRLFFIVFLFLGITVNGIYYLQSVMEKKAAFIVGAMHSVLISTFLCVLLPIFLGMTGIWLALPLTELLISVYVVRFIKKRVNPKL